MLTDILQIWTPDNGDQYALVQDLAAIMDDVELAILNPPYIRLTNTADASPTSTGHAFQIGPTEGSNLIMDQNEILSRNGGAVADFAINAEGGNVNIGNDSSVVRILGHINGSSIPWAVAAGSYVFDPIPAGAVSTVTIPFPSGRFTAVPVFDVNAFTTNPHLQQVGFSDITTTGVDISYANMGGSTVSTPRVHWQAIQMTSSSGGG